MDSGRFRLGLHALYGKARESRGLSIRAAEHSVDMSDRSVRVRYQIIGVSDRRVIDSSAAVCSGCRTYHASQQYGYSCVSALQYQAWRTVRYWTIPSNFGISVMCSVGYGYCIDIGIEFDTIPINKKKESIRFRYLIHRSFPQSVSA